MSRQRRASEPPSRPSRPSRYPQLTLGCRVDAQSRPLIETALRPLPMLASETAEFWLRFGPDTDNGGFHGRLGRRGEPLEPATKGVIQQAQHLWTWSSWYERREPTERVRQAADSCYAFLVDHFLDPNDGEFVMHTSATGEVVTPDKLLYSQAFAIYALATYASVFGVARAEDIALRCFDSIERRAHDSAHGGYDVSAESCWMSPGTQKETSTHTHLMEALTTLYAVTRDERIGVRLAELADLCATRLLQPAGYLHEEFLSDWTPHGSPLVCYGLDLETAWLLVDAELTLGQPRAHVIAAATRMACHAAKYGFDGEQGGFFEEGIPHGPVTGWEKLWWVQFDALPGLWWTYRLTGETLYLERLLKTLDWLQSGQRDPEFGEWYWGVRRDGNRGENGDVKGELWKAAYHNVRSLLLTEDWIRVALAQAPLQ